MKRKLIVDISHSSACDNIQKKSPYNGSPRRPFSHDTPHQLLRNVKEYIFHRSLIEYHTPRDRVSATLSAFSLDDDESRTNQWLAGYRKIDEEMDGWMSTHHAAPSSSLCETILSIFKSPGEWAIKRLMVTS